MPHLVPGNLRCGSCGYLLRGLAEGASCPECGAGIANIHTAARPTGVAARGSLHLYAGIGLLALLAIVTLKVVPGAGRGSYPVVVIAVALTNVLLGPFVVVSPLGRHWLAWLGWLTACATLYLAAR